MYHCAWLLIGSTNKCNKLSKKEYCGLHQVALRRGSTGPQPCIVCGVGVRGKTQLCANHGGKRYRELKRYYDVYTHVNHRNPVIQTPQDYVARSV